MPNVYWTQWLQDRPPLLQEMASAISQIKEPTSPVGNRIFEFLEYGSPDEVRVVIIEQDPYPDPKQAMGLAFSSPTTTPSLRNIVACLRIDGHRDIPDKFSDLRHWASQGVMLLNTALTTAPGRRGAHIGIWSRFTTLFLFNFIVYRTTIEKPVTLMLWGGHAQSAAENAAINPIHRVIKCHHPSPVSDNRKQPGEKFQDSGMFAHNSDISWDIPYYTIVGFDGSCTGNGTDTASAGYAVVGGCGSLGTFVNADVVHPNLYKWRDSNRPELGLAPDLESEFCAPTNNRAEFLGGIHALSRLLLAGPYVGREVVVVTDSMLFLNTIKIWYPSRLKKKTTHEMKNLDLVRPAYELWEKLNTVCNIDIVHEKAHTIQPRSSDWLVQLKWKVNSLADHYATKHQKIAFAI